MVDLPFVRHANERKRVNLELIEDTLVFFFVAVVGVDLLKCYRAVLDVVPFGTPLDALPFGQRLFCCADTRLRTIGTAWRDSPGFCRAGKLKLLVRMQQFVRAHDGREVKKKFRGTRNTNATAPATYEIGFALALRRAAGLQKKAKKKSKRREGGE